MTTCETCRKVEDALNRILNNTSFTFIKVTKNFVEANIIDGNSPYIGIGAVCDLPIAILELADKVDPPKPKEREWKEGDLVEVGYDMPQMPPPKTVLIVEKVGSREIFYTHLRSTIGWIANQQKEKNRNLTIEAEQAEGG